MPLSVCAIAAMDEARVIGRQGKLPWHIPEDLKHFSDLTSGHTVMMGRKTWDSLPARFRPLPRRKNIVVSRTISQLPGAEVWDSPQKFIEACRAGTASMTGDRLWIIGGAEIYRLTVSLWDEVYLTQVKGRGEGDAFFPEFEARFKLLEEEAHEGFAFQRFIRR